MARRFNIFNIPSGHNFLKTLYEQIIKDPSLNGSLGAPSHIGDSVMILPTKRAVRQLHHLFIEGAKDQALLLPRFYDLGSLAQNLNPAFLQTEALSSSLAYRQQPFSQNEQICHTARLIFKWSEQKGHPLSYGSAFGLAKELISLLDDIHRKQIKPETIYDLEDDIIGDNIIDDNSQTSFMLLKIITQFWSQTTKEQNRLSFVEMQNHIFHLFAQDLKRNPPKGQVFLAGSRGSQRATADLMKTIGALPKGCVVLSGLDDDMTKEEAKAIGAHPSHPQFLLLETLSLLGVRPDEVQPFPSFALCDEKNRQEKERSKLLNLALCPPLATKDWGQMRQEPAHKQPAHKQPAFINKAHQDLSLIEAKDESEEAGIIALCLRQVLEDKRKNVALVTPRDVLARRVSAELKQFGIEVDQSGGQKLSDVPEGLFVRLLAETLRQDFSPVSFMALMKHPLSRLNTNRLDCLNALRAFEIQCLRDKNIIMPKKGLEALIGFSRRKETSPKIKSFLSQLKISCAGLKHLEEKTPLWDLLPIFCDIAKAFAQGEGQDDFLSQKTSARVLSCIDELAHFAKSAELAPASLKELPDILDFWLGQEKIFPSYPHSSRVQILDLRQARLIQKDVMILAGLNEGVWPHLPSTDHFLSRRQRKKLGLDDKDISIGLQAHDFVQAACAKEVILVRSSNIDNAPTIESRFLLRLKTLLKANKQHIKSLQNRVALWRALNPSRQSPCAPPAPCPPILRRPKTLSVTQIEVLIKNPYAIYARHILGLKKLPTLDRKPQLGEYGIFMHQLLEQWIKKYQINLPENPLQTFLALGRTLDKDNYFMPFYRTQIEQFGQWFMCFTAQRQKQLKHIFSEIKGTYKLSYQGHKLFLSAIADHIEIDKKGGIHIFDYKTGLVPKNSEMKKDALQLPLIGFLVKQGGFEDINHLMGDAKPSIGSLAHIKVGKKLSGGEIKPIKDDEISNMIAIAQEELEKLITHYANEHQTYAPKDKCRFDDYMHLSRRLEWDISNPRETDEQNSDNSNHQ